ncbi:unnamed protein product [Knipowitschia caucasica]|uniref:Ig-like domain-containing protein n=1 Tax=Knipowitschia caucasica TaxID=637954 RepID=A0AAV2KKU8_KNICA
MLLITMWIPLLMLTVLPVVSAEDPCALPVIQLPSDIVRKVGENLFVNCTTPVDGHQGIYWTYDDEKLDQELTSYTELQVPHINWDFQAKCTILLNSTYNCSANLQVQLEMNKVNQVKINETTIDQHEFSCDIPNAAPVENLNITWFTKGQILKTVFDNKTPSTTAVSSLGMNVSKEHDGESFTCVAVLNLGPDGHVLVSTTTWNISVQYAPKLPQKDQNDKPTVAKTTTAATATEATTGVTAAASSSSSSSSAAAAAAAAKPPDCPVTITPNTIIVKYGEIASATCNTTVEHDGIGWEATNGGVSRTEDVTYLQWNWTIKDFKDFNIEVECFINPINGTHCKKPLGITVYNIPNSVQISPVENIPVEEGNKLTLKCDILNIAPINKLRVNWYQEDTLVHTEVFNGSDPHPLNVTSFWDLTPEKEHNNMGFKCEVELRLGQNLKVVSASYTPVVQYKPRINPDCPKEYGGKEDEFTLDTVPCKASGNPQPNIYWYFKDKLVDSTKTLTRNDSGEYTAKFENTVGSTNTTFAITIEYKPYFSCKDHYNVRENTDIGSVCEPAGIPKPELLWVRDEKQVEFSKWERCDSGDYVIVATNKHGKAQHNISINVLFAPSFPEDITQEFHMGENLTVDCRADGNPLPQLHWKYPPAANVNTASRGRQIHITEATSTNAGVYSCNATNEVGSVTRTVTLIMKGKTHMDHIYGIISISVVLALLFFIFGVVLICRNCRKKSGHYDVISDDVPLNPRSSVI